MKTIDTHTLRRKLSRGQDFVFLNVLPEKSYKKEHIPGSENIPVEDPDFIEKIARRVPDKNAHIIVYCASMECDASTRAVEKLNEAGYTNVTDYEGGMKAWKEAELEVAA